MMPIYKYRCEKGHEWETFQNIHDAPLEQCDECKAPAKRLINSFGYMRHWNGTGVFVFDREGRSPDWSK